MLSNVAIASYQKIFYKEKIINQTPVGDVKNMQSKRLRPIHLKQISLVMIILLSVEPVSVTSIGMVIA